MGDRIREEAAESAGNDGGRKEEIESRLEFMAFVKPVAGQSRVSVSYRWGTDIEIR